MHAVGSDEDAHANLTFGLPIDRYYPSSQQNRRLRSRGRATALLPAEETASPAPTPLLN